MSDSSNLDIKITTSANTAGAKAAEQALKGVGQASKDAGQTTTTELRDKARRATVGLGRAFEGVGQAARGGAESIKGIGQAIGGIFAASGKMLWVGLVIEAVTRAAAIFSRLRDAYADTSKASEEEAKKASAAWVAGMERAAAAGDTKLVDYFKEIARAAEEARKEIDAVTTAILAQIDADEAVAVAQIDANETLSDSEKHQQKATVRATYRASRADTQLKGMAEKEAKQAQTVADAQGGVALADTELKRRRAVAAAVEKDDPEKLKAEREAKKKELGSARQTVWKEGGSMQDVIAMQARLRAEIADLEARIARGGEGGAAFKDRQKQASEAVSTGETDRLAAEKKAADEARALAALRKANAREREVLEKTTAAQQTVETLGTRTQVKAAQAKEEAERAAALAGVPARVLAASAGRVRNPGDLDAKQEEQVVQRALEINRNAASLAGVQAGETIGEAFGMALKELFPQVTNEILRTVRSQINEAVKAESARIQAQNKNGRTLQ